ncbi:hypothetical protein NPM06_31745, partial [Bacillus cereus]|uniref:hypothetical protein n=1 Tax=Bacillus cereus TaxID=1396 RepID=UPI00211366BB|nr:hypothetical protein [Bacillus cereus]
PPAPPPKQQNPLCYTLNPSIKKNKPKIRPALKKKTRDRIPVAFYYFIEKSISIFKLEWVC